MSTQTLEKVSAAKKDKLLASIASLQKMPVVEVAELLLELETPHRVEALSHFSPENRGYILAEFPIAEQLNLFKAMSRKQFAQIFEHIPSDSQADLFQHLTQGEQAELLPFLQKATRDNVIHLSAYPPESAGGIMSTDFATVFEDMSVAQAIAKIRQDAPSRRTVYYNYVVNKNREMQGFVTLKDLIMAEPHTPVKQVMKTDFAFAYVDEDREEVAKKIEKYDLVALPILNKMNQLVGIVTHDEAIDIIRAEHTEDMERFMGIVQAGEQFNYLNTSMWRHFQKRVGWLVSLAAVGIISGLIIHRYENALEKLLILALYMPMVADTGGNCGSQAATVVVRALALGQIHLRQWLTVLWKEMRVGLLLAACLGVLAFAKVLFLSWETEVPGAYRLFDVALVIALALSMQVVTATVIGAGLPLLVKRLGGDPAVAASPAITTVVDITGLLLYFGTATVFFAL